MCASSNPQIATLLNVSELDLTSMVEVLKKRAHEEEEDVAPIPEPKIPRKLIGTGIEALWQSKEMDELSRFQSKVSNGSKWMEAFTNTYQFLVPWAGRGLKDGKDDVKPTYR